MSIGTPRCLHCAPQQESGMPALLQGGLRPGDLPRVSTGVRERTQESWLPLAPRSGILSTEPKSPMAPFLSSPLA